MSIDLNFKGVYKDAHLSKIEQSVEVVEKMLNWTTSPRGIFYFCGNVGNGKTYFSAAWFNSIKEKKSTAWIRAFDESALLSTLKNQISEGKEPRLILNQICECDFLIIDDFGVSKKSEWSEEILYLLIDIRNNSDLPTLITSNLTKEDVAKIYHPRIYSRLFAKKNVYVEMNGTDRRQE